MKRRNNNQTASMASYLRVRQPVVLLEGRERDRLASRRRQLLAEGAEVLLDGRCVHVLHVRLAKERSKDEKKKNPNPKSKSKSKSKSKNRN
jgi:hypothetical protein